MKRLLTFIFTIGLMAGASYAQTADISCGKWERSSDPNGPYFMTQTTVGSTEFDAVGAGATAESIFALCAPNAALIRIIVSSEVCTDCDIVVSIAAAASAGGDTTIFSDDALVAQTVDGTAYTQYLNVPVANGNGSTAYAADVGTDPMVEWVVYVRVTNNDGVVRNVEVTLFWRSR